MQQQSIINRTHQNQSSRNSVHQNTSTKTVTAYQEYIANRQSASKSLSQMCYNCVNNDISDQKKKIKQKLIEQDKAYVQELTKSILKQQEDENTQIIQKKLREKEFLQKSYQESQKYKEERKSKEKQEYEKLAQQIKKTDIQDQNRIQQELIQSYYKKKQFMESLNEQIKSKKIKTQDDNIPKDSFKVGDEEKTEQIIQQKKIIERNLLKQQRDESLKMKESVLNEQEKLRKQQERQQADYQHQLDQQIKLAEQGKKRLMETQYSKYLQKAILEQKEKKRNERIMTAEEYRLNCELINKQTQKREEIEQNQEIQKKLQYIEDLNQQCQYQLECKAQDKQKNRFIEQKLSQSNKKYEYLRKELEKPLIKPCQKCNKSYDAKCLSKSKIF